MTEFVTDGNLLGPAPPEVAELYLHKDASRWFKRGNANPIGYLFPEDQNALDGRGSPAS